MAQYKVISDRLVDFKQGEVVDEKAFGDSLQWLTDAGHIAPVASSTKTKTDDTKD
jgi:hypothetical protein